MERENVSTSVRTLILATKHRLGDLEKKGFDMPAI
jgi:hypothetical protein